MIVLFDGTKSRPWGRMLFCEESTQRQAPPSPVVPQRSWGEVTRRIRDRQDRLTAGWWTASEIADLVGVPMARIDSAIGSLVRRGEMAREMPDHPGGHGGTGYRPQRYRWTGGRA